MQEQDMRVKGLGRGLKMRDAVLFLRLFALQVLTV
jgi:hypothetical protein